MKSFKLISLQIVTEELHLIDIVLTDGLIINKENDARTWLLEAFVEESHFRELESSLPNINGEVFIQAVITKKDNEPALFSTVLRTIRKVGNHYSLLFVGHIQKTPWQICRTSSWRFGPKRSSRRWINKWIQAKNPL